ncbi:hypothetical protein BH09MYX1_BH09MYX1_18790 [soil metagenome]
MKRGYSLLGLGFGATFSLVTASGCNLRPPVLADMTCPTGAELRTTLTAGACELPSGTKNGPSYRVDPRSGQLVEIVVYDHDVVDGAYARYGEDGRITVRGSYRNGKKDGLWIDYEDDGRTEAEFFADAPVGPPRHLDANGDVRKDIPTVPQTITPPPTPPPNVAVLPPAKGTSDVDAMADEAKENARETEATGVVVSPARVRIFRFEGDVAFDAHVAYSAAKHGAFDSGFVGATVHAGVPFGRLTYKRDHYSGVFVSVGGTASYGQSLRADSCGGPCATNEDARWGQRWLVGPYARVGYARSHDGSESGAIRSFFAFASIAAVFGEDTWALRDNTRQSAFVWRARLSTGYTAPSLITHLLDSFKSPSKKGDELWAAAALLAAIFVEHGELFAEVGTDGNGAVVSGFGIQLGMGL